MSYSDNRQESIRSSKLRLFAAALSMIGATHAATIPDVPLHTMTTSEPNIMMVMDDSGSMHWEITPDSYSYYVYPRPDNAYGPSDYGSYVATTDDGQPYNAFSRSPQSNPQYYNPAVTYRPWAKADGFSWPPAIPKSAYHNPARTNVGSRDLTVLNRQSSYWETCISADSSNCNTSNWAEKIFWPATYFWLKEPTKPWAWASYDKVEIRPDANYSGHGRTARTDCTNGTCTYDQEIQNFANWYRHCQWLQRTGQVFRQI